MLQRVELDILQSSIRIRIRYLIQTSMIIFILKFIFE